MKESEKYLQNNQQPTKVLAGMGLVVLTTDARHFAKLYAAEMIREFVEQNIGIQNWQLAAETFIKNNLTT
jgi:hypothetical protein